MVRNSNVRASQESLNQHDDYYEDAECRSIGSRRGSFRGSKISIDKTNDNSDRSWQQSFSFLRRGSSRRKRHTVENEQPESQERETHLRPYHHARSRSPSPARSRRGSPASPRRRRSPTPIRRSPSPRRGDHDIGFSDAVTDLVSRVKHEGSSRGRTKAKLGGDEFAISEEGTTYRGRSPVRSTFGKPSPWRVSSPSHERSQSISPEHQTMFSYRRSHRHSPNVTPTHSEYYSKSPLDEHTRSLSPASAHSLPLQRISRGRKLPPTPIKPSTLYFGVRSMERINFPVVSSSPTVPQPSNKSIFNINFPRVNASPTHLPKSQMLLRQQRTTPSTGLHSPSLRPGGRVASSSISLPRGQEQTRSVDFHSTLDRSFDPLGHNEKLVSFQTTATVGRSCRQLPSLLSNGYKPGQRDWYRQGGKEVIIPALRTGRVGPHVDSDDDWC
ncbi:serine/arginine repetitive matrix protein 1-like [Limulus polyphemus]|uniref:Serine/arginine repetitive matrix protein 1-like n=1 Tax=Limulus polyphemus TaxID=6850 RepID=A0ABM1TRX4_LIMPO|nr:serine/arginine repetitive matrix protein 1-like [Limulus polyphemus]